MPIDWTTVGAQILNFMVLVWILKRSLYRPVLAAVEKRQKRAEESMLAASGEREEAARERDAFEEKSRELEREREASLTAAAREGEAERARLVAEARQEYQSLRDRWRDSLHREQDELQQEVAALVQREALAIAGQLVRELADANLQERLARKFVQKLDEMPPGERAVLAGSPDESDGDQAVLRSGFELDDDLREEVERAARAVIGRQKPLRFETRSALGAGIELAVNGRKAAWTIDHYLDSLDAGLRELAQRKIGPDAQGQE